MPSMSLARPAALCAGLALVLSSAAGLASPPAIPPVATIPVPPLAAVHGPEPVTTPVPAAPPAAPPAPAAPPLAAMAVVPSPSAGAAGSPEAAPAPAPQPEARHVVLVDELPFRATHMRARELTDHPEHTKKHGRHGRPFHPAPGIVVDVVDASGPAGSVSAADVQRAARNVGYWPIRHCYEEGLRRDQHLSGKISLELALTPGGSVDRDSITSATLHDESVALCVAREAQHLALPAAQAPTTARVDVTLATGDEPVPVQRPAPHADDLRDALRTAWPAVEQCYASALPSHPDAGGRMELRFRVRPDGAIDEVVEGGDARFADVDVTRCVLGVYRTSKLPEMHRRSHDTTFVYALHFEARPDSSQNVSPTAK